MKTNIIEQFMAMPEGKEAAGILQSCVHCGFCNATCPTYLELGDERDGPRGRIYLMKQYLEGESVGAASRTHLDRCLSCASCETSCPSGVQYTRLLDISRGLMEENIPRPLFASVQRWLLRRLLPHTGRLGFLLAIGRLFSPILPRSLRVKIPEQQTIGERPENRHDRRMLILEGCVQSVATPKTNGATARVLDKLEIQLVTAKKAGCCGAVNYHLGHHGDGLDDMRRNIDAWWPYIESGDIEAVLVTASGCGATVKDYGHLLRDDPAYSEKAKQVSELFRDLSQVLQAEDLSRLGLVVPDEKLAIHIPCTLQHALGQNSAVRDIFDQLGYTLAETTEDHLCCGSAGTYSLLQPQLSSSLLARKLEALSIDEPNVIVTANIGCQLHLQSGSQGPVKHWIELLDQ